MQAMSKEHHLQRVLDCGIVAVFRFPDIDQLVAVPGAFTPTEILTAREAGADIVKVFPADVVGPAFFKAVRAPLPQIRLMPTGGVDLSTAAAFLKAGACCLGVGGQLVEPKAVAERNFTRIRDLAQQYVAIVKETRAARK